MKKYILLFVFFSSSIVTFAQKSNDDDESNSVTVNEKCNCSGRTFESKAKDVLTDDKFISEYLIDYKIDSGSDNNDYVNNLIRERLKILLAKKIRSKVTSEETHVISEKSTNNSASSTQDEFKATAKSESKVDLSGMGFRICPDKKEDKIFHGVIWINKAQFLTAQLSQYKMLQKELETQVNVITKNSMDYSQRELAKELSNCLKKKDKIDQIAVVYSSLSTKNEMLNDPDIQKSNEVIIPKLAQLKKKIYNKDVEKKADSAKYYLDEKKFPEAMTIIDQILKVNPDHDQMKDLQKQCYKSWAEDANFKVDDLVRNNNFEEALNFIKKTLDYKIAVNQMNDKLNSVTELFFNDMVSKLQTKINAKDVATSKKMLKKLQPYSKINQQKYDELAKAVAKLDW